MSISKKALAVTTAIVTAAGVVATADPAAAAMGQGRAQICAKGAFDAWLVFEGGLEYNATYLAAPGKCIEATIPGGTYAIGVWTLIPGGLKWQVHRFGATPSINPGVKVFTYGTNILNQSATVTS